jgi:hypothetical protein
MALERLWSVHDNVINAKDKHIWAQFLPFKKLRK